MRACLPPLLVLALAPLGGCGSDGSLQPGDNDQDAVESALIEATPGSVIQLGEGTFHFDRGLSLTVNKVTIRGKGKDKTLLSFKGQSAGSQGLLVKADDFAIEDLAVLDTKGDAIKINGGKGISFRRVRVEWSGGPQGSNGPYGLYPVQCQRVLIEDCEVSGASDAGIYVGQSDTIIVRRNRAENNVAGIEIENSRNADVYENTATQNAAGILVFDLPGLQMKGGRNIRVFNNQVVDNNTDNFAPEGNIVGNVPRGTGMFVMANDRVEFFGNTIKDNKTVSLGVISYLLTELPYDDKEYDPYPEGIYVHDNTVIGGGDAPDPTKRISLALVTYLRPLPVPDVVYDGLVDKAKLVGGMLPDALRLCIKNNQHTGGTLSFANLDAENIPSGMPKVTRDLAPHDCTQPALPAIAIPGVQ